MKPFGLYLLICILFIVDFSDTIAQVPVRTEDHFWRKRAVRRIDLNEKINRPLVNHESQYYIDDKYTEQNGIVAALINGLKRREYIAFHPDDWDKTLDYGMLVERMIEFDQALTGIQEEMDYDAEGAEMDNLYEEFDLEEPKGTDGWGSFEYEGVSVKKEADGMQTTPFRAEVADYQIDYAYYEESLHIVEDWVFNRARSSMQQNIDYFEVIWTDPSGMLAEKILARFKWEDVKEILARTQWKNRFNDSEVRSIKEVCELRIFHGYLINYGGVDIRTLREAQKRELEMIEFEHHLWSH